MKDVVPINYEWIVKEALAQRTNEIHDKLDWKWLEAHCTAYSQLRRYRLDREQTKNTYDYKYAGMPRLELSRDIRRET